TIAPERISSPVALRMGLLSPVSIDSSTSSPAETITSPSAGICSPVVSRTRSSTTRSEESTLVISPSRRTAFFARSRIASRSKVRFARYSVNVPINRLVRTTNPNTASRREPTSRTIVNAVPSMALKRVNRFPRRMSHRLRDGASSTLFVCPFSPRRATSALVRPSYVVTIQKYPAARSPAWADSGSRSRLRAEHRDRFDVVGVGEEIVAVDPLGGVSALGSEREIAGERGGVTRDVDDPLRFSREHLCDDSAARADAGRVEHDHVRPFGDLPRGEHALDISPMQVDVSVTFRVDPRIRNGAAIALHRVHAPGRAGGRGEGNGEEPGSGEQVEHRRPGYLPDGVLDGREERFGCPVVRLPKSAGVDEVFESPGPFPHRAGVAGRGDAVDECDRGVGGGGDRGDPRPC